jgi:hypothetical protein
MGGSLKGQIYGNFQDSLNHLFPLLVVLMSVVELISLFKLMSVAESRQKFP